MNTIRDQVNEKFFTIYPPIEIKQKIIEANNEERLPRFTCEYVLRSALDEINNNNYIEIKDKGEKQLVVDIDFHNVKLDDHDYLILSAAYKKFKKELGSDFEFKIDGRTEDGTIYIEFIKVYKPLFSRMLN